VLRVSAGVQDGFSLEKTSTCIVQQLNTFLPVSTDIVEQQVTVI